MTTIFSWWQCIGRSCASSAHATRVPDVKASAHRANLASGGAEERQGWPGPGEQPHRDALGHLGEEVAQHLHLAVATKRKVGREVPAGEMHVRLCIRDRVGEAGQGVRSVHHDLDGVAGARRRVADRPASNGPVERDELAVASKPPAVVRDDGMLDGVPEIPVDERKCPAEVHGSRRTRGRRSLRASIPRRAVSSVGRAGDF